ncbi:MAG: membrane dipeptidase [Candidatus Aminicenantes bacterium]|nr:membrane dipeptidase [Candidatus Aminicenantes bacterium]
MTSTLSAETILRDSIVVDAHGHMLDMAANSRRRLHESLGGLTDVPLMRAGGVTAQLTACWMPDVRIGGPHGSRQPFRDLMRMVDYVHRELDGEAGDHVVLARTAGDIEGAAAGSKAALVLGLEGGDALRGELGRLRELYEAGLRHVCLVHEGRNAMGVAAQVWEDSTMRVYEPGIDPPGGLSDAGRRIVREMNRLGMLVDVTHMVEESFWETLEVSSAPVVASHGNARSLRDTVRYLTNEQIGAVAETGGMVCPSPFPLGPTRERPSLEMMLRHVDYMVRLVGPDHVGFGTDFLDQTGARPAGFGDIGETPRVAEGLLELGYAAGEIRQIMGGNFLRVFRRVAG